MAINRSVLYNFRLIINFSYKSIAYMLAHVRLSIVLLLLSFSLIVTGCASRSSTDIDISPSAKKSTKKKSKYKDEGYVGVQNGVYIDVHYKFDDESVTVATQNISDGYLSQLLVVIRQEVKLPKSANRPAQSLSFNESQNGYDLLEPDKVLLIDQIIPINATGQVQVIVYAKTNIGDDLIRVHEEFEFNLSK